jgi:hypothetical protein
MLFSHSRPLAWAALLGSLVSGSPTPAGVSVAKPQTDLVFREALELAQQPHVDKRLEASFSMEKTWTNEVLFAG